MKPLAVSATGIYTVNAILMDFKRLSMVKVKVYPINCHGGTDG
jgi:hypothetical protein